MHAIATADRQALEENRLSFVVSGEIMSQLRREDPPELELSPRTFFGVPIEIVGGMNIFRLDTMPKPHGQNRNT